MGYATLGGASIITGLIGMRQQEAGARVTGQLQAHAARYEAAVTANQALVSAENAARTAEAKAESDLFNAKVAEQLGEAEVQRSTAEATDFRRSQDARLASHRATQAASGLALEGSPLMVDEAIMQEIEFGAQRIAHTGQVGRTRALTQSILLKRAADIEKSSAKYAREAGQQSAKYAVEAGEIGARGAITASDINATAARLSGIGQAFRNVAELERTILTGGLSGSISAWGNTSPLLSSPRIAPSSGFSWGVPTGPGGRGVLV